MRIDDVRKQVEVMELETRRFYERAIQHVSDADVRKLLGDLTEVERRHYAAAAVVGVELAAISYVRHRYMDTPFPVVPFRRSFPALQEPRAGTLSSSRSASPRPSRPRAIVVVDGSPTRGRHVVASRTFLPQSVNPTHQRVSTRAGLHLSGVGSMASVASGDPPRQTPWRRSPPCPRATAI